MIEVRVAGQGRVRGEEVTRDTAQAAACDLCGGDFDTVASVDTAMQTFACKDCLRGRLEAMTLGAWLIQPRDTLPWGKLTS